MEMKENIYKLEWRVVSLGQRSKFPPGVIPIGGDKFRDVKRDYIAKGYGRGVKIGSKTRYEHYSIMGLYLYIDENNKIIRVESSSEGALSQVCDDFNLPLYVSD